MPTIVYDLKADTGDFGASMNSAIGSLKSGAAAAGVLASGVLAAGAAIAGMAGQLEAVVDEVNTLAASSGLSTSSVNALRLAAEASGKSLSDLVPKDLALRLQKVADGNKKASKGFDELGVSVLDQSGGLRDANDVYQDTLAALLAIEDPTLRAAKANQALGTAGAQALSAFRSIEDFEKFQALGEEFGFRTGPEAVAAMGQFQIAQGQVSLAMETATQTALDMVGGMDFLAEKVSAFALGFVFASETVAAWARETVRFIGDVGGVMAALASGDMAALNKAIGDFDGPLTRMGDALQSGADKAQRFWTLNQTEAPKAADQIDRVVGSVKAQEMALKAAEKAAIALASTNRKLSDIAFKASADILTEEEKIQDAYLLTLESIDEQGQALKDLSATGQLTGRDLVRVTRAREAAEARLARDLEGLNVKRLDAQLAAERKYAEDSANAAQGLADLKVEIEESLQAELARKRQLAADTASMALNTIGETAAIVSDLILANLQKEGDGQRRKLDQQMAVNAAIREEGGEVSDVQRQRARALREQLKETNKQVKRAFAARQASAVGGIAIDAAQGILSLIPFFAFLGPGAPAAAAGIVAPVALAQTAAVLSEKAPKVHDGTANVDEVLATLRRGESVLNQRGSESIGREAVERANRGLGSQGAPMTQIVFRGRVLDTMMAETIEQGGRVHSIVSAGRPPPGTLDPFGGQ